MATPKETKNGWTQLEYIGKDEKGNRQYKRFTAKTRKELELKVSEFKKEITGHEILKFDMTVGEAVDEYINARENIDYSPKTIREYKLMRRNALQGLINVKLYSLTDRMIQEGINKTVKAHSPKTVSMWWGLFGSAIRKSRKGYIPDVVLPSVKKKAVEVPAEKQYLRHCGS